MPFSRLLGPDQSGLTDTATIATLQKALDAADGSLPPPGSASSMKAPSPVQERVAGRWVRWFDLGRVAPYEGSNVATTVGGITPRLADVASFYRAFGVTVIETDPTTWLPNS